MHNDERGKLRIERRHEARIEENAPGAPAKKRSRDRQRRQGRTDRASHLEIDQINARRHPAFQLPHHDADTRFVGPAAVGEDRQSGLFDLAKVRFIWVQNRIDMSHMRRHQRSPTCSVHLYRMTEAIFGSAKNLLGTII
jgi:hypothetical protein